MNDDSPKKSALRLSRGITRLQRARPASVIIMVVALLVLMALIGTAFITTARVDRYSATQNTYNTQVDLLSQSILTLAESAMYQKLTGATGVFRQLSDSGRYVPAAYHEWESPISDLYLADRTPSAVFAVVPGTHSETSLGYQAGLPYPVNTSAFPLWTPWDLADTPYYGSQPVPANSTFPVWMHITAPLNATSENPTGQFEAPFATDMSGNPLPSPVTYTTRDQLVPWDIAVPQADGSTKLFPAFIVTPTNSSAGQTPATQPVQPIIVLAADADGDGIADSGFIRLGGGQIEGATYYGAVRVIDNAAAINASIAYGINQSPSGNAVPGDFFPTNIDLQTLANTDTLARLNRYRFNKNAAAFATAIDDTGVTHSDFAFSTPYEALWMQLGCRLNNPGYIGSASTKYQALPVADQMNMAYHFCLANPNVASSSRSVLERCLPNTTLGARSARGAYSPADPGTWFFDQFYYNPDAAYSQQIATGDPSNPTVTVVNALRASLVVHNPVSNYTPSWFTDQGIYGNPPFNGGSGYSFGDQVQFPDPNITGQQMRGFVCIQPHTVGTQAPMNGNAYNNAYWAAMPWSNHPTKINANTGTFGQLWTAYWSVMQDSPDSRHNYPGAAGGQVDTDLNNHLTNTLTHQFRSSIRNRTTPATFLTRSQMIQLRAALAAVNTIDMRDGDTDITSRTIALTSTAGQTLYANVYGAERQPYFSALMIDYEPTPTNPTPNGPPFNANTPYVVVELYNPHPVPIRLTGWKLASLSRSGVDGSITLKEVGDLSTTLQGAPHAGSQTGAVILPGERIVLHNNAQQPINIQNDWTTNKVVNYTNRSTTGADLDLAVGHELVLLRPRVTVPIGVTPPNPPPSNSAPENTYNEAFLTDLVPLDNLDLAGIGPSTAQPPQPQRYRYARANKLWADLPPVQVPATTQPATPPATQPTYVPIAQPSYPSGYPGAAWHCVYPGPYNLLASIHHAGMVQVLAADTPTVAADNGNFGRPNGLYTVTPTPTSGDAVEQNINGSMLSADATYETRPLKINSLDQAGPNRPYVETLSGGSPNGSVAATTGGPLTYPLGGFARRGDLLEVPFIGSYVISSMPDPAAPGAKVYEMNSVTMDSAIASYQPPATTTPLASSFDLDTSIASTFPFYYNGLLFHNELIGHFCPMTVSQPIPTVSPIPGAGSPPTSGSDFTDDPTDPYFSQYQSAWTYHWAKSLFDYLDVFTPQDAYLPNVDPAITNASASGDPTVPGSSVKYPASATPSPVPISSSPLLPVKQMTGQPFVQQLQGLQETAGLEGQININTAEWRVLSSIPFYTPDLNPTNYAYDNAQLGAAIVQWRDYSNGNAVNPYAGFGPYRSIFDIMKITGGQSYVNSGSPANISIWKVLQGFWAFDARSNITDSYDPRALSPGEATNQYGSLSPFAPTFPAVGAEAPIYPPPPTPPNPPYVPPPPPPPPAQPSVYAYPVPSPLWTECDLTDHVFGDAKSRFLAFTRISNLITTRSDSFTVYSQVQAWQNIGTPNPTLVATKRAGTIFDRSQVKPVRVGSSSNVTLTPPSVVNFPND